MSTGKVRGGRRLDASYDTDGEEPFHAPGNGRLRRNLSFRGNATVDNAPRDDSKLIPDPFSNVSLDRRHRNPLQKAVEGFRNIFRNMSTSSPSLQHMRRSPGKEEPYQSIGQPPRPPPANPVSHGVVEFTEQLSTGRSRPKFTLPNGRHPGAVGIQNHGNTCFMNAVIQCLSNTDLLVEYLLSDELQAFLDEGQQRCQITKQLVLIIESLWTGSYQAEISYVFKELVGKCAEQYSGTAQNDAQEFLLWLLDKVNEELCSYGDRAVAINGVKGDNNMANNNNNNNTGGSIIFNLFQAKYRSTLTCPSCHQQSDTYEPFLSVSLPIQQKNRLPVYVTVAYMQPHYRQVRFGLMMSSNDTVADLRNMLARKADIKEKQLLLTQIYDSSFQATLSDSESLLDLETLDFIYGVEMSDDLLMNGNAADGNYPNTEALGIVAVNRVCDGPRQSSRFGGPFVVKVSRDFTGYQLRSALLNGMRSMVPEGSMEQVIMENRFFMRIVSDVTDDMYLRDADELPLYAVAVDEALSFCGEDLCSPHIKLVLEWKYNVYKRVLINTHPSVICDQSYRQVQEAVRHTRTIDLQDCFSAFTQQEELGDEDTWFCPNCHKGQQGTMKSLNLCSLPDIMIVHLKRFKQEGDSRSKLNTLIKFPINGLDMTYHLTKGQALNKKKKRETIKPDDYMYDLYGVCNHDGNMSQGHYRAICKNPLSGQWYLYDDAKVKEVREEQIVTHTAYLLFYKRRQVRSRCERQLEQCISQFLSSCGVGDCEPTTVTWKANRSDQSYTNTRPAQQTRSSVHNRSYISSSYNRSYSSPSHNRSYGSSKQNHSYGSDALLRRPVTSTTPRLPPMNNSFHASLKKPLPRKTPTLRSAMGTALAVSTPVLSHSPPGAHSKSQPLQESSPPADGSKVGKVANGKLAGKQHNNNTVDFDDALTLASAFGAGTSRTSNRSKTKLIFEKAANGDSSGGVDERKRDSTQCSLSVWQQKKEKFVQESSV